MTSRERVLAAIMHIEPDMVPFDCTFSFEAYNKLKNYLGLNLPDKVIGDTSLTVSADIELLLEFGVDMAYVGLNLPSSVKPLELGTERYVDEWGIPWKKVEHSGGSFYYEMESNPLADATINDLDDYPWPDPDDPARLSGVVEKAQKLFHETDLCIVGKFAGPIFEQAFMLRGMERFFMDMVTDPEFCEALLSRITDIAIRLNEIGFKAIGEYMQVFRIAGDDMGSQNGMLISPEMFRRIIKPHFQRLYSSAKSEFAKYNPNPILFNHTCGDVYPIIPDYIEMGLDVLNNIQPGVAEMEHKKLKREFGDRLAFHGGISLQGALPFGNEEDVEAEVKQRITDLASGGGYILAPAHYVQHDVPPQNLTALRDAVRKHGKYPTD